MATALHEGSVAVQDREHARLVVGTGPTVDAPFRIDGVTGVPLVNDLAAARNGCAEEHRLPWIEPLRPLLGVDGLAVVMGIENDGARSSGHLDLAEHRRIGRAGPALEQFGANAAP